MVDIAGFQNINNGAIYSFEMLHLILGTREKLVCYGVLF